MMLTQSKSVIPEIQKCENQSWMTAHVYQGDDGGMRRMGETEGRRGEGDEMSITQSFSISCVDNVISPLDLQPVDSSSYILMSIYICSFHCSESWLITVMPIQWNGSFGATVIHCECIYLSVTLNFVSIALSTRFVYLDSRLSVLATTLRGTLSLSTTTHWLRPDSLPFFPWIKLYWLMHLNCTVETYRQHSR